MDEQTRGGKGKKNGANGWKARVIGEEGGGEGV